jgi:putative membrane protein
MNFFKRVIVIALALVLAGFVMRNMDGFEITRSGWVHYAVMAIILAILNASLLPFLKTMTCGMIVLTLGLFSLVLNALVFWISSWISTTLLGGGFSITKFWPALVGSIIVSLATTIFAKDSSNRKKSSNEDD